MDSDLNQSITSDDLKFGVCRSDLLDGAAAVSSLAAAVVRNPHVRGCLIGGTSQRIVQLDLWCNADWTVAQLKPPDDATVMPVTVVPTRSLEVFLASAVKTLVGVLPARRASSPVAVSGMSETVARADDRPASTVLVASIMSEGRPHRSVVVLSDSSGVVACTLDGDLERPFVLEPTSAFASWGLIACLFENAVRSIPRIEQ